LGFGLLYPKELDGKLASIIFLIYEKYSRETSKGIEWRWVYPTNLD
jgi:hypothetical protein